jgi:hypothetical protein
MSGGGEAPPVSGFAAEPGLLTDVVFEDYVGHLKRFIPVLMGITFALIAVFSATCLSTIAPWGRPAWIALCFAPPLAMGLLLIIRWQKRAQAIAREAVAAVAHDGVAGAIRGVLDRTHAMSVAAGLHATLSLLAQQGHAGTTLRICKTNEMVVLDPLTYPFEPQPLNEMHSALIRQQSAEGENAPGQAASAARSFARNVALKGGWLMLVIVGFDWVLALKEAIVQRAITWHLMVFSLLLLMLAFMPARWGTRQWFVVPGGVVLRKSGWRQRRWHLKLFVRCQSVLCVSHWTRNIWSVTAANARTSFSRNLTRTEAEFLLRAWLSPLPPPPVERLADLQ